MVIQLPADPGTHIHDKVARGDFSDANEVVREAMSLLDARDHQRASLRAKVQAELVNVSEAMVLHSRLK